MARSSAAPEFARVTTVRLWAMRETMIQGQEAVGLAIVEGLAKGPAVEGARLRAALVDRVDAELLSRGEKVPAPFWLDDDV